MTLKRLVIHAQLATPEMDLEANIGGVGTGMRILGAQIDAVLAKVRCEGSYSNQALRLCARSSANHSFRSLCLEVAKTYTQHTRVDYR